MMWTLCCLLSTALMVQTVLSDVAIGFSPIDPDHPKQCYDPDTNELHDLGSKWQNPGVCATISCYPAQNESLHELSYIGCGTADTDDPNCRIVQDLTKEHPHCCPHMECNN